MVNRVSYDVSIFHITPAPSAARLIRKTSRIIGIINSDNITDVTSVSVIGDISQWDVIQW